MAYTYRFIDTNNNVIYVGYTAQRLNDRMNQHFTKGHYPQCYSVWRELNTLNGKLNQMHR